MPTIFTISYALTMHDFAHSRLSKNCTDKGNWYLPAFESDEGFNALFERATDMRSYVTNDKLHGIHRYA